MWPKKKHHLLFALACFFFPQARAATITGIVKGPDGAPFMGAFVQAQNTKTKITVNVLSHKDGEYDVDDLPPGDYEIRIRAIGYQADPRLGVSLKAKQKLPLTGNSRKAPCAGAISTSIRASISFPTSPARK